MKNNFLTVLTIFFILFLLQSCGTSRRSGDEELSEDEQQQQQDLDEIEALLGVTPDKSKDQKKPPVKEDDTLGLLGSGDMAFQQGTADPAKVTKLEKEVKNLKSQIEEKDLIIADMKAQIRMKNDQIQDLETSTPVSSGSMSYGKVGDVPQGEYAIRYQEALDLFHARDYRGALQLFESLLATSVNNSLSDNAQYWIGESHYALREYDKAIIDFEKVFTFPKSNKNDAAQFKLGLCYMRKGNNQKAREEFQRLLDLYPKSEYIDRAQKNLNSL